jgi:hypothetical protein
LRSHLRFRKKPIERLTSFNKALVKHEFMVEGRQAEDWPNLSSWESFEAIFDSGAVVGTGTCAWGGADFGM